MMLSKDCDRSCSVLTVPSNGGTLRVRGEPTRSFEPRPKSLNEAINGKENPRTPAMAQYKPKVERVVSVDLFLRGVRRFASWRYPYEKVSTCSTPSCYQQTLMRECHGRAPLRSAGRSLILGQDSLQLL